VFAFATTEELPRMPHRDGTASADNFLERLRANLRKHLCNRVWRVASTDTRKMLRHSQGDRIFPREFLMFGVWAGARLSFLC
jgi:hypothetical protein